MLKVAVSKIEKTCRAVVRIDGLCISGRTAIVNIASGTTAAS